MHTNAYYLFLRVSLYESQYTAQICSARLGKYAKKYRNCICRHISFIEIILKFRLWMTLHKSKIHPSDLVDRRKILTKTCSEIYFDKLHPKVWWDSQNYLTWLTKLVWSRSPQSLATVTKRFLWTSPNILCILPNVLVAFTEYILPKFFGNSHQTIFCSVPVKS